MAIHGSQEEPDTESHLSISIKAIAGDGMFEDQKFNLQISRKHDFDETNNYAGALFQSKPSLMFGVSTNPERFGHIVSLIANKALKEIYFCFETPRYGRPHQSLNMRPPVPETLNQTGT